MKKEGKRRLFAATACAAALAVAAVTGTLAYLTDEDSDVNVMTLGNVQIEQVEQEYDENGRLVAFTQDKPLYPYVGELGWKNVGQDGSYRQFTMNNVVDKYVSVKNTGESDAYVRTFIALEMGDYKDLAEFGKSGIGLSTNALDGAEFDFDGAWEWTHDFVTKIDGKDYNVMVAVHKAPVGAGESTVPSLLQVYLSKDATNEVVEKLDGDGDGKYNILAFSQAVQTQGFNNAQEALNTAFGNPADGYHPWANVAFAGSAEELVAALEGGKDVVLTDDVELGTDETIVIEKEDASTLNLNGYTLSGVNTRTATHNFMIDVDGGALEIVNGTVSMEHDGANMGWAGAATVINVTGGGALDLEDVIVKVDNGTDMNFAVHLNNWGEVTLNAKNCVFDAPYCGVRVFNSGPHMNNVTIEGSTLKGGTRAFWVHNYVSADMGGKVYSGASAAYDKAVVDARLNLDIYGNNNKFEITGTAKSPIRYGFNETVYYDANGNVVA